LKSRPYIVSDDKFHFQLNAKVRDYREKKKVYFSGCFSLCGFGKNDQIICNFFINSNLVTGKWPQIDKIGEN